LRIVIELNKATRVEIEPFSIFEREFIEPIFDGKKFNFITYSFYSFYKKDAKKRNLSGPDLSGFSRLFHRSFDFKLDSGDTYVLIRTVSDDLVEIEDAIEYLRKRYKNNHFSVIIHDIYLDKINPLDEYRLGKFLDTSIDKAMIPYS